MLVTWIKGWYYSQTINIKYTNSNFSATCKERRVVTSTKNNVNTIQSTGAHLKWNKLILHQETGGCNRPINNTNIIHLSTQSSNKAYHSWNFKNHLEDIIWAACRLEKIKPLSKKFFEFKNLSKISVYSMKNEDPGDFQAKKIQEIAYKTKGQEDEKMKNG